MPITTLESLQTHLQWAIEVEHSTIPPYLCALYSIPDGENQAAANVIRSVVMEEMLHMTLAANILNAVGGAPDLVHPAFIPEYPTVLPHSDGLFEVNLLKFSEDAIDTFLKIEHPAAICAPPQDDNYQTIAQFYEAIGIGITYLVNTLGEHNVFTGNRAKQVTSEYYYGGGGEAFPVHSPETAAEAINEIVEQGEGYNLGLFDGDHANFGQAAEYAHYFRFNEIRVGRFYAKGDTPDTGPTGPILPRSYASAYNMGRNPRAQDYPEGSEIRRRLDGFNQAYMCLLRLLNDGLNGQPEQLQSAVAIMYGLKYKAVELMRTPSPLGDFTVGPSFQFFPYEERKQTANPVLVAPIPEAIVHESGAAAPAV